MKERPILFSAPMVRAIRDGRKTQTRRVVKPQPPEWVDRFGYTCFTPKGSISGRGNYKDHGPCEKFFKCPYGIKGDRLWVRETFANLALETWEPVLAYRADGEMTLPPGVRWRPSIHMPRWASRLTLEITGVRVERLQGIGEEDALSEGMSSVRNHEFDLRHWPEWRREFDAACAAGIKPPLGPGFTQTFQALWGDINGAASWQANPWVWVVEFRRAA